MKISEWLDDKENDGVDVSLIVLPHELSYGEDPIEMYPCGNRSLFMSNLFPFIIAFEFFFIP
jgi:hypothetical protein